MKEQDHFRFIFWFIVALTFFGAAYTTALTFIPIPKGSERFADTGHVFWLSTAVAGGIGYLIGNSASQRAKTDNKGTNTVVENAENMVVSSESTETQE